MGKGKAWSDEESLHLAQSWIAKSEEEEASNLRGANQDSETFWKGVKTLMAGKCPVANPDGVYNDRAWTAMRNHWRDQLSRDVKKFNKALQKVYASRPTGCTEENKINMAVAVHLGKSDAMQYRHKDFDAKSWKFHISWQFLKSHRAFLPPSPPSENSSEGDEDENENESEEDPVAADDDDASRALFVSPGNATALRDKSRGPGPGSRKTKAKAEEEECRKKKTKIQEGFLAVQQERQADFKQMVNNHARQQAFKMAVLGYNTFKDDDPEEAEKYKQTMNNILSNNTLADDDDLPPLDGDHDGNATGV